MFTFNQLLEGAGLALGDVRLLRHSDRRHPHKPTPYALWRDRPDLFEAYQATQSPEREARLRAPVWAAFVSTPDDRTLFAGLYRVALTGILREESADLRPELAHVQSPGVDQHYETTRDERLSEYVGRLYVAWGDGRVSWVQRPDRQVKPVEELARTFEDPPFPGFARLILPLSEIGSLPPTWRAALTSTSGVYVLTCPRTREQYVGIAHGAEGFLGRWLEYARTWHGGNVALKSRDPSDYQVAILETVGSATSLADLEELEALWKRKLQSREMGLNRN